MERRRPFLSFLAGLPFLGFLKPERKDWGFRRLPVPPFRWKRRRGITAAAARALALEVLADTENCLRLDRAADAYRIVALWGNDDDL